MNVCGYDPYLRYRCPEIGWLDKFRYVVGIVHTNYVGYAKLEKVSLMFGGFHFDDQWVSTTLTSPYVSCDRPACNDFVRH